MYKQCLKVMCCFDVFTLLSLMTLDHTYSAPRQQKFPEETKMVESVELAKFCLL